MEVTFSHIPPSRVGCCLPDSWLSWFLSLVGDKLCSFASFYSLPVFCETGFSAFTVNILAIL